MPCPYASHLKEKLMKRILIAGLMAILFTAAPAAASIMYFNFTFVPLGVAGGTATAQGTIGLEMSLLTAPGRYLYDPTTLYQSYGGTTADFVSSLTVTVNGSDGGNGTFTLNKSDLVTSDYVAVLFDVAQGVNFNQGLIGQQSYYDLASSTWWNWGTDHQVSFEGENPPPPQSYTGDFQIFSLDSSLAPYGIYPYQMATGGGEPMQLTSFGPAAVPEPSTYALLCIALGVVGFARRKLKW